MNDAPRMLMAKTADYDLGPFTYPRGWLMVAASETITSEPSEAREIKHSTMTKCDSQLAA